MDQKRKPRKRKSVRACAEGSRKGWRTRKKMLAAREKTNDSKPI